MSVPGRIGLMVYAQAEGLMVLCPGREQWFCALVGRAGGSVPVQADKASPSRALLAIRLRCSAHVRYEQMPYPIVLFLRHSNKHQCHLT